MQCYSLSAMSYCVNYILITRKKLSLNVINREKYRQKSIGIGNTFIQQYWY